MGQVQSSHGRVGPNGAVDYSHGCRDGAAKPTGAEPVERICHFSSRPEGAKE